MAGRRARPPARRRQNAARIVTVLALLVGVSAFAGAPLFAQELTFPQRPAVKKSKAAIEREKSGQKQMLVQASEIDYDYVNHRVAAVGSVQIYFGGSTIEADKVIYDQTSKRLHAEGNVRLDRSRRQGHLRRHHGSVRRLSRRLRRLAAPRHAGSDAHGGGTR